MTNGNETTLREGDLKPKESNHAPIIRYLIAFGVCLMLPLVGDTLWLGYKRHIEPRPPSPQEIARGKIQGVIAAAEIQGGFDLDDYIRIIRALRQRYGVQTLLTGELLQKLRSHPQYETIERVFTLEEMFFKKDAQVTPEQHQELMAAIDELLAD